MPDPVDLLVLLWAVPGRLQELKEYEDRILKLIVEHGGKVVDRLRNLEADGPSEVHLLHFSSQLDLDAYMNDGRRLALAHDRERCVARSDVIRVERV